MQNNLVIVESPAKAKTIEKFLGKDYKVLSSYGHIRDLKKKGIGVDVKDDFLPDYEIPTDKEEVVGKLKKEAKKVKTVWLASDEDREGEAIAWHLYEVLGLKPDSTRRIVFHEITKTAILQAIETPRNIDINLVNAQQARRVLDRIVGFELSPVLWRKVKPSLSAGRVQSVTVRLIVEREREIQAFKQEAYYRVVATFLVPSAGGKVVEMNAELSHRLKTKDEAKAFLEACKSARFGIKNITTRPVKRSPAPPFTTSTLQQEAARKLGFTVAQTMMLAQHLYEAGFITYMRTDSVNLSDYALATSKETISGMMGDKYVHLRHYQTNTKGAQEAHEAIRPTYLANQEVEGNENEKKLYELIWKRTVASQMANAELERTTVTIETGVGNEEFSTVGEVIKFDGFLRVYRESVGDENDTEDEMRLLPTMKEGQVIDYKEMSATERFTQRPARYTEASLVHKLEELGIGRPSTYAPTISTIQQRQYVEKNFLTGEQRDFHVITLQAHEVKEMVKSETVGAERGKLCPTDIGTVVNDFLLEHFPSIMDYNFTANVEKEFDEVAEGATKWTSLMKNFYTDFHPLVESALKQQSPHKVGERILGNDPVSGRQLSVKIGRFGPVAMIGLAEDEEKPRFSQLKKGQSIETITLEEALDLFKLPRDLGELEGKKITVGTGRFGPYIHYDKLFVSIPKTLDPLSISQDEAENLIREKQLKEKQKHLKTFEEEPELEILNGRFGPYICYKGVNYKIPKDAVPQNMTLDECKEIISAGPKGTKKAAAKKSKTATKTATKTSTVKASTKKAATSRKKTTAKVETKE